jgi:hypothetical protein
MTVPLPQASPDPLDKERAATVAERQARRRTRLRTDGKPIKSEAEKRQTKAYNKAWRQTSAGKAARRRDKRAAFDSKPFVGCDGEGCGEDEHGRQHYMLFRMGERELFTGKPLTTPQILNFILDSDPTVLHVGFSFGYDVTQILRDMNPDRWGELFKPRMFGPGHSPYTWIGSEFGVDYLPRNFLRVRRYRRLSDTQLVPIAGSERTIYETFGFFQKSFVAALDDFDVGTPDERAMIARNKEDRGLITAIDQETRDYCALECGLLAAMMTKFRTLCIDNEIYPREWSGAGKISDYLHQRHGTITAKELEQLEQSEQIPKLVTDFARKAYYGGRFEVPRIGDVPGPIYNYDINSAYPDAMRRLPCLRHGTWDPLTGPAVRKLRREEPDALYVAEVRFAHPDTGHGQLCGLPIRHKSGRIYWPREGNGVYWSCEIVAAEKLGATVSPKGGWRYRCHCDCQSYPWVEHLYNLRISLGKDVRGIPLKLGLNGAYGKLAQRIGNPKYGNPIHASLITALTRTKLIDAVAQDPTAIAMLATDGILSVRPLHLDTGDGLGQWDVKVHPRVFVVQPGIYWGGRGTGGVEKRKTRGVSPRFLNPAIPDFERKWQQYRTVEDWTFRRGWRRPDPPIVKVKVELFIGLRLARARRKPNLAGCWIGKRQDDPPRKIRFDWRGKRGWGYTWEEGRDTCVLTDAQPGYRDLVTVYHDDLSKEALDELRGVRLEMEDQPDIVSGSGFDDDDGDF